MNFEEFEREQAGKSAKKQEAQEVSEVQEALTGSEAAQVYVETDEDGQRVIRIRPREYDPALDPESAEFDRDKWESYQKAAKESLDSALAALKRMQSTITDATDHTLDALVAAMKSETWQGMRDALETIAASIPLLKEIEQLAPYLEAELHKPEYQGKTIDDLLEEAETDKDGNPTESSLFIQALTAARKARDEAAEQKLLPKVSYQNGTEVKTVTDKFANLFFSLSAPQSRDMISGQRSFIPVQYERAGAKKEITLLYDYSFNEDIIKRFGLSRNFDDQSFFVASIVDNLLDEGNNVVSLTKIWHELGNSGSPSQEALTDIINILRLGMSTIITADVSQVNEAWAIDKDGTKDELTSPVIPVQFVNKKYAVSGKTANAVINIMGHTPFYIIGCSINHFTTWNKDVLRLYTGRRTKRYYSVLRFLMNQIGWMRNAKSKRSNKILYKSLHEHTGAKSTRDQQLDLNMMYRLFDEVFIPTGYITSYKEDPQGNPGVKITYEQQKKIISKK